MLMMVEQSGTADQFISVPVGGGALKGLGEAFVPDLQTGTGQFTVPLALPSGRNGLHPDLNLSYGTAAGNGPFGLGWKVNVPTVARKTSKGVPRYRPYRAQVHDRDKFVFSEDDLVPVDDADPRRTVYRPRTEITFARIVHLHHGGDDHWDVRTRDGTLNRFGSADAAGADPAVLAFLGPEKRENVAVWRLTATEDPFGNRVVYTYHRDRMEQDGRKWDQLYPECISYGEYASDHATRYLINVQFRYEERPDPFSDYRFGFEVRTRLRCTEIHVEVHKDDVRIPVRTYRMRYLDQRKDIADLAEIVPYNGTSLLSQVQVIGYDDVGRPYDDDVHDGAIRESQMPPLEMGYSSFEPKKRQFAPVRDDGLPANSFASAELQLADVYGDGLPHVIEMRDGRCRVWRNRGKGAFDLPLPLEGLPAGMHLSKDDAFFADADGDGRIDLLAKRRSLAGYFAMALSTGDGRAQFRRQKYEPSFNLGDPEVAVVDLDGDGAVDAIRSGTRFELFFNDPRKGWDPGLSTVVPRRGADVFPNVSFADPRVRWADMNGDGLQDVVLLYDRNVEYWPSMGRGNWGSRIHMLNSPQLPRLSDHSRVLLGDIDGDGLADIVLVEERRVVVWINQSGNGWSEGVEILGTPPSGPRFNVRLEDLLGTGIRGILWSTDATAPGRPHTHFLSPAGRQKPYLLNQIDNHMGAATAIAYESSVDCFLRDESDAASRWPDGLPVAVQVVRRVATSDEMTGNCSVTEFDYHYGSWDGAEREFRGFAMVDKRDAELLADRSAEGSPPPVLTRTWFHMGPLGEDFGDWREEYSVGRVPGSWLEDPPHFRRSVRQEAFLAGLPRRVRRDAIRALRGVILRTECFVLDGTHEQWRPYSVTERSYDVRRVVEGAPGPSLSDEHLPDYDADHHTLPRVFFPSLAAERTTRWDRGDDPATRYEFSDDYDGYGQAHSQTSVACPRGWRAPPDRPATPYLATRTAIRYATPSEPSVYIWNRVAKVTTWEIRASAGQTVASLHERADDHPSLLVVAQRLHYYDGPAFEGLQLGRSGLYGALTRTESLFLTPELMESGYGEVPPTYLEDDPVWPAEYPTAFRTAVGALPAASGYRRIADSDHAPGWFANVECREYDFQKDPNGDGVGLLLELRDGLKKRTRCTWDRYNLLPVESRIVVDPLNGAEDLELRAAYNYRTMQPSVNIDANGNVREYEFSPLGLLTSVWLKGRPEADPSEGDVEQPSVRLEYNFLARYRSSPDNPKPIYVRSIRRLYHDSETTAPVRERDETLELREYSDGFGRLLQSRSRSDNVRFADDEGDSNLLPTAHADHVALGIAGTENNQVDRPNVVVSGWQVYDGKGQVVRKYETFFEEGWAYRKPGSAELAHARAVRLSYDPHGQIIRSIFPEGAEHRIINGVPRDLAQPNGFDPTPWETYSYDANDLAPVSSGPDGRSLDAFAPAEHHFTPKSVEVDALGRAIRKVERTGSAAGDELLVELQYDVHGNLTKVVDELGRVAFEAIYDLCGRRIYCADPNSGVRRTVFDPAGNVLEVRDGRGALSLRTHDRLNRPVFVWARDLPDEPLTLREYLVYGEDAALHLSAGRNLRGRLYRHDDEAGRLTYERYDVRGNLVLKRRRVISDEALLRPFAGGDPGAVPHPFRVDWAFHGDAELEKPLTTSYSYDAVGWLRSVRFPLDAANRRTTARFSYNSLGLLVHAEVDGQVLLEQVAYNARSDRLLEVLGNGIMVRYAWDDDTFRLRRIRIERCAKVGPFSFRGTAGPAAADRILADSTLHYDLVGNIIALHERSEGSGTGQEANSLDRTFTYDPIYRLSTASGRECAAHRGDAWNDFPQCQDETKTQPYLEAYSYDKANNLLSIQHRAARGGFTRLLRREAVSDRLTRLEGTGGRHGPTFSYDANGNITREGLARNFEWDHANRLRAYRTQTAGAAPTLYATYLYDSSGARVKRLIRTGRDDWESTTFVDNRFEQHRLKRPSGQLVNQRLQLVVGDGCSTELRRGPAFPKDGARDAPVIYRLASHQGNVEVVVGGADLAGNTFIRREEYTPFGETTFGGYGRKRYRFSGKERDRGTNFYYHGARYYAPWLGRWSSTDPVIDLDGLNRYAYARNNPLVLQDPDGRKATLKPVNPGSPGSGLPRGSASGGARMLQYGARAGPGVSASEGAGVATKAGIAGLVVGLFVGWTVFWVKAVEHSGERHEERVRRIAMAENLRDDGLISQEEATQYILTGQLFASRGGSRERTVKDAYRAKYFELGREFQQHVLESVLNALYEGDQLAVEYHIGTVTGIRRPDFARWDREGTGLFEWIGDAKLGSIELDDQMRGLIDEATRTTARVLILFTPEGVEVPRNVIDAARDMGVAVKQHMVPFAPLYIPDHRAVSGGTSGSRQGKR